MNIFRIKRETIWVDDRSEHCNLSGDVSVCEILETKVDPCSGDTSFWQMLVNGDEAIGTMEKTKSDVTFKTRKNKQSQKNKKKVESERVDNVAVFRIECQAYRTCKFLFESNEAMQFHAATYHANKTKKEFHCHLCKRKFGTRQQLQPHMLSVHIGLRPFKCPFPLCPKAFSYENVLRQHINAIHTRAIMFKCTKCPRKFTRKEYMTRHLANKHRRGVTYCCYLCGQSLYAKRQLHFHMNTSTPVSLFSSARFQIVRRHFLIGVIWIDILGVPSTPGNL